jgi:hypothetical protein
MDHFIEYICRGVVRSEDAICRLNKRYVKLAKHMNRTNVAVMCIGVGAIMVASVVWMQDNEIKALQKQVADLTPKTEEQNQQEGA